MDIHTCWSRCRLTCADSPMEHERQQVPARSALPGASGRAVADASHGSDSPEQSIDDRAHVCSPLWYRRPSTSASRTSTC